jgi:hypothetical protein
VPPTAKMTAKPADDCGRERTTADWLPSRLNSSRRSRSHSSASVHRVAPVTANDSQVWL